MGSAEGAGIGIGMGMGPVGAGDVQSVGILWDVLFLSRICYTDTSSPQEDQYPPNIAVKVNHSYCSVPVRKIWGIWEEYLWNLGGKFRELGRKIWGIWGEYLWKLGGKFVESGRKFGISRKLLSWWMSVCRSAVLSLKQMFCWISHVVNELFCIKTQSCSLWAPAVFSSFSLSLRPGAECEFNRADRWMYLE